MRGAKDGMHEKDTFSPQVIHSFTKETHLTWVTEQENKAGYDIAWHEAMLLEIGASGDQLEISGSLTYWEHQHLAQNKCARNAGHFSYLCQPPQGA